MIKKGYQLTCEGCGAETFVYSNISPRPLKIKTGIESECYNENQSESWDKVHTVLDLCPRCSKIYEEVMCTFYEKCNEARAVDKVLEDS